MDDLFKVAKEMLIKNMLQKKLMLIVGGAVVFLLFAVIVVMMFAAPIMQGLHALQTFQTKTTTFIQKLGNFLTGRGYIVIDAGEVSNKEAAFFAKLQEHYEDYYDYGEHLEINAPLIYATVYYPMTTTYDNNTYICINELGSDDQVREACKNSIFGSLKDMWDYWDKKTAELANIIRHSVVKITTTYGCKDHHDKDGNCTGASRTEQIGDKVYETPFIGHTTWYTLWKFEDIFDNPNFPDEGDFDEDESCDCGVGSIDVYDYKNEIEGYNKYLREEYIPKTAEYMFPPYLTEEEKEDRIEQTIDAIWDLSKLYEQLLVDLRINRLSGRVDGDIPYKLLSHLIVPVGSGIGNDGKANYRISSCFQQNRELPNGVIRDHIGIDLNVRDDGKIKAVADGKVIEVVNVGNFNCYCEPDPCDCKGMGYGNSVKIEHNILDDDGTKYTFYTFYAHLASINVDNGPVSQGDIIGVVGNTGNSSGPHLHFEYHDENDIPVDPGNLFTNPYEMSPTANCRFSSEGCTNQNHPAATSNVSGLWEGNRYPISVVVSGIPRPLEQYILGVTIQEMSASNHKEALKAQMIAARGYLMGTKNFCPKLTDGQIVFDVGVPGTTSQDYNLAKICSAGEYANNILEALGETRGKIMLSADKLLGAHYGSCAIPGKDTTYKEFKGFGKSDMIEKYEVPAFCECYSGGSGDCGNGIGFSQNGAKVLAESNNNYTDILGKYYYFDKLEDLQNVELSNICSSGY